MMEIRRVFDLLEYSKEKYFYKDDIIAGKENGEWVKYSVNEYIEESNLFSLGLLALGLERGDRIISISNNRPEWNFIDMGACQAGLIHVPVYPTISKDDYFYILNHCQPKIVIVSDKQLYDKIEPIAAMAGIKEIYSINSLKDVKNWRSIQQKGGENKHLLPELEKIKADIKTTDLFTIIYTSGTTGFPKGVMLSHSNIINNFLETAKAHISGEESCVLSFLPLSHVYERCLNYHYQYKGMGIYYAENLGTIAENSREVKPVLFCAVPRVIEMFFEKILSKGHELPFLSRKIFFWAVKVAEQFDLDKPNRFFYYNIKLKIANKLVFSKWREALGGKLDKIVSGGASLQIRLIKIFWAAKIQIIEGYGLTETSPVIAVNNLTVPLVKFGTVGPVLPGVQVKIADDGEILCKGHNVMLGYYKDEELTKEVIDKDGWFHTGDIGMFVDGKFLKITDRKKEIFKLSNGKYVAPQVIENKLKESEFIEQAIVLGEHQKFASALIIPNFPYLHTWSACYKITFSDNNDLVQDKRVIDHYNKVIAEINKTLGSHEQIKRFKLLTDEWSATTGELSPTLKLKRNFIQEKYKDVIEQIYPQK